MAREFYCQNYGTVGKPKTVTRGSFLMEVFLWLLLIVPGAIYSLWRLTTKAKVCLRCGASPCRRKLDAAREREWVVPRMCSPDIGGPPGWPSTTSK